MSKRSTGSFAPGSNMKKLIPGSVVSARFVKSNEPGSVRFATLNRGSPEPDSGMR